MKCARCNQEQRKHTGEGNRCPCHAIGYNFVAPLLTPKAVTLLKALADPSSGDYDSELVYERGAGWWSGSEEVSGQLTQQLILLCLISMEPDSRIGEFERWAINEEGHALLADPMYRPKILTHPEFGKELL